MPEPVDLDLHGVVGIRLLDAEPADVATVVRQLGLAASRLTREPDITVRFVDRLVPGGSVVTVGRGSAGFTDEGLYVLSGKGGVPAKALIPMQDVGRRCDIVCERAMPSVPLLLAVVNFTALAHGVLPLHASAFEHDGRGVVVCGWAKGGKTEVLLSFAAHGARYVGDEWVYLAPDRAMFGVPEPIRLWRWQLRQLEQLWAGLPPARRARLQLLGAATWAANRGAALGGPPSTVLRRGGALVERQQWVQVPPVELFGTDAVLLRGRVDDLVLASVSDSPDVTVRPVSGREVADRMRASLRYERRPFADVYEQFRFAFPSLSSDVVDTASERESALLHDLLPEQAWWLCHPYPVDIRSLYRPLHDRIHP